MSLSPSNLAALAAAAFMVLTGVFAALAVTVGSPFVLPAIGCAAEAGAFSGMADLYDRQDASRSPRSR